MEPPWDLKADSMLEGAVPCEEFIYHSVPLKEMECRASCKRSQVLTDMCVNIAGTVATAQSLLARERQYRSNVEEFVFARAEFKAKEAALESYAAEQVVSADEAETSRYIMEKLLEKKEKMWEEVEAEAEAKLTKALEEKGDAEAALAKALEEKKAAEEKATAKEREVVAYQKAMDDYAAEIVDLKRDVKTRDGTLNEYADRINTLEPELRKT